MACLLRKRFGGTTQKPLRRGWRCPPAIPNLWIESDFDADIQTPFAILQGQASSLTRLAKGALDAEVVTANAGSRVSYRLQLIAPLLGSYRKTVVTVVQQKSDPYPARVEAEMFAPGPTEQDEHEWPVAWTFQELLDLVKKVLQSGQVRSTIQSLIARSKEPASNGKTADVTPK